MKRFLLSAIALVVAFAANAATAVETTTFQGKIAVGAETIPEIGDDSDAATGYSARWTTAHTSLCFNSSLLVDLLLAM